MMHADINIWPRFDDNQVLAHPLSFAHVGERLDAQRLRLIAGRDAAGRVRIHRNDRNRTPSQFRTQLLLDRCEIRVQIEKQRSVACGGVARHGCTSPYAGTHVLGKSCPVGGIKAPWTSRRTSERASDALLKMHVAAWPGAARIISLHRCGSDKPSTGANLNEDGKPERR